MDTLAGRLANASMSRSNRFCGSSRPTAPMAICPFDRPNRARASGTRPGSRRNAWWSMPFSSTRTRSGRQPWATRSALTSLETATTTGKRPSTRLSAG